ncbi:MAG: hypothetical protein ABSF65_06270 [Candidatus Bathyarchaeia archaeon]|jgi:hypothetical protein
MSSEMDKIKKVDELGATIKKHTSAAEHTDTKRLDDLETRLKALEEKPKRNQESINALFISNIFLYGLP